MKKLSLSLLSLILVSIIALGMVMDLLFDRYFLSKKDNPIAHYQTLGSQLASALNKSASPLLFIEAWHINNPNNDLQLVQQQDVPLPNALWQQLYVGNAIILETELGLTLYWWLTNHQQLLAFSPTELRREIREPMISVLLTTGFYVGIIFLLLLWLFPLLRSLQSLRKNALAYGKGDFSARIQPSRFSYLDDIEQTFNRMAEQIETLIQDNKLISSAVSHDLRTPLARLRFGIDILSETDNPIERSKYQEHLSNDIDEMQSLVEALLNYARLEQSLIALPKAPVDLLKLLIDFRDSHPVNVITLEHPNLTQAVIQGHEVYLKMCLHNLLNNALHYGESRVLVTVALNQKRLCIHIHDDGSGIPEAQRNALFKPFVRGEHKNSQPGFGMGLAIAERIAHWHDSTIVIQDSTRLSGAEFIVQFA